MLELGNAPSERMRVPEVVLMADGASRGRPSVKKKKDPLITPGLGPPGLERRFLPLTVSVGTMGPER